MPRYSMHSVMNVSTSVCTELQSRTCLLHMTTPSPCFHQQIKTNYLYDIWCFTSFNLLIENSFLFILLPVLV